jgi:hypothetical protein
MHSALKIFVPGIFLSVLTLAGYRGFPTSCVRLPNGINIGKQALIDLSASYFRPDIVPKFENGASLLFGDAWPFFVTETTVYGLALEADYRNDFWFAWRKDTGLVRKNEEPERYDKIVSEAGDLLEHTEYGGFDSHIVMINLQKSPEHQNQTCRTRLLTW